MIVYDGERAWGQIAAREATLIGIAKARETGVAVVALRNPHHIGRVGKYGEMCAEAGLVSFHFVNVTDARPAVAPWRGTDARFSTNPVCIAIPGPEPERPIILDMATSVVAMGKVRVARNKGEQIEARHSARRRGQADDRSRCDVSPAARGAADLWRAQGLCAGLCLRDAGRCVVRQRHDAARAAGRRHGDQRHADDRHRPGAARRPRMAARRDRGDDPTTSPPRRRSTRTSRC